MLLYSTSKPVRDYTPVRSVADPNQRQHSKVRADFGISGVRLFIQKDDLPSPGIQKRIQRYELATVNNRAE
jgi:hypothetical protein